MVLSGEKMIALSAVPLLKFSFYLPVLDFVQCNFTNCSIVGIDSHLGLFSDCF